LSWQIRSTHPYSYRSGEWADLLSWGPASEFNRRMVYFVRFEDGTRDWWAMDDPDNPCEFRIDPRLLEILKEDRCSGQ
jgi:hypothetical protein